MRARRSGVLSHLFEQCELVFLPRDDDRAGVLHVDVGPTAKFKPAFTRKRRDPLRFAVSDAGEEQVTEVADARSDGVCVAIQQDDREAASARLVRMCEPDDPGPHHTYVGIDDS